MQINPRLRPEKIHCNLTSISLSFLNVKQTYMVRIKVELQLKPRRVIEPISFAKEKQYMYQRMWDVGLRINGNEFCKIRLNPEDMRQICWRKLLPSFYRRQTTEAAVLIFYIGGVWVAWLVRYCSIFSEAVMQHSWAHQMVSTGSERRWNFNGYYMYLSGGLPLRHTGFAQTEVLWLYLREANQLY